MTSTRIEYRDNGEVVAEMNELREDTRDYAIVAAQKYLDVFPGLVAHVIHGETETIVHRATEWQKRNG